MLIERLKLLHAAAVKGNVRIDAAAVIVNGARGRSSIVNVVNAAALSALRVLFMCTSIYLSAS